MEETEYSYWEINYFSCEGNERWTISRAPIDWDESDVSDRIQLGGCGDDPARIEGIFETSDTDYNWDFCD